MSPSGKKVALIILDGWGIGKHDSTDAIFKANTPFIDGLMSTSANATLNTTGEMVGLPKGQMGNSEVGHMNIGAGRIVFQDLARINKAVENNELNSNVVLRQALDLAKKGKDLHLIGLVSHGGVHSTQKHLHALIDTIERSGVDRYFVHAFTDGRDTDPNSGVNNIAELDQYLSDKKGKIASVIGRYFAMDRDHRWERIKKAYDVLVHGKGNEFSEATKAMHSSYDAGVTDEFIEPIVITENNEPTATIKDGDVVLCFNFRTDRCRQITRALTQEAFPEQGMRTLELEYYTMTKYDEKFKNISVLFKKEDLKETLGEVIANNDLEQTRMAETEKYPHVTFFFSGGRERTFKGESRIMVHSPKVATYDLQPEMSAFELTDRMLETQKKGDADLICLNYANPDMVGHTGNFEAIVKAVETTDQCVEKIVECGQINGYSFIIIADHGNADNAVNEDGSPNTAHSTNPVPFIVVDKDIQTVKDGILADMAPTVLDLLGIEKPALMTGRSLLSGSDQLRP